MTTLNVMQMVEQGIELNDEQRESFTSLITYRCRSNTVARVRSIMTYDGNKTLKSFPMWLQERIVFKGNDASYVAGQSYPDEIRSIRERVLK